MKTTAVKLTEDQVAELSKKGRLVQLPSGNYNLIKGEVTPDQLDAWKNEYAKRVFMIEVFGEAVLPTVQEVLVGYFRKPDRIHIARAMGFINANQTIEAGESLLDDTWLGGDERLRSIKYEDTEYRIATANELYLTTSVFEAKIKNV